MGAKPLPSYVKPNNNNATECVLWLWIITYGGSCNKLVYYAVLAEKHPGAIEEAAAVVPRSAIKHVKVSLKVARGLLEIAYPRALETLTAVIA